MSNTVLEFIRFFVESGCWWYGFGLILISSQLSILGSLALPTSASHDGLLTVKAVERGCALSNVVAFASFWSQFPGLIGSNGLTPANDLISYMRRLSQRHHDSLSWQKWLSDYFLRFPTIFWIIPGSDFAIHCVCGGGCILSILLFLAPFLPTAWNWLQVAPFITALAWWTCGCLYLSLIHVSGDFLGLQSDSNTVEIDFLLGLLSIIRTTHPGPAVVALRFFAFRKMLGCGICKWYGSSMWTDGTAMTVHYFTQPLPNRWSYYAHHMPLWFHRFSVVSTFVVEILLPYLIFLPSLHPGLSNLRYIAWFGFNSLNLAINTTGNYGFIGFLNTAENLSITDDALWRRLLSPFTKSPYSAVGNSNDSKSPSSLLLVTGSIVRMTVALTLVVYMAVSSLPTLSRASKGKFTMDDFIEDWPLRSMPQLQERLKILLSKINLIYKRQHSLRLCNYQGKFGSMHDFRWEPIIEGSRDGVTWYQYKWKYKLNKGPNECGRVLPLHLPRLDWRVWFLPLYARRGGEPPEWYDCLLEKLLTQRAEVVALLGEDPFRPGGSAEGPPGPPRFIRSRLEDFTFAPKGSDRWWKSREIQRKTPLDMMISTRDVSSTKED